jgi:hypothetical protein
MADHDMKVRIGPIEANVVSNEVAETADIYVCADWDGPVYFTDDLKASCAMCRRAVRHRPYGPKRPMKLCMKCGLGWAEATRH